MLDRAIHILFYLLYSSTSSSQSASQCVEPPWFLRLPSSCLLRISPWIKYVSTSPLPSYYYYYYSSYCYLAEVLRQLPNHRKLPHARVNTSLVSCDPDPQVYPVSSLLPNSGTVSGWEQFESFVFASLPIIFDMQPHHPSRARDLGLSANSSW